MPAELATQVLEAGSFAVECAARALAHGGLVAFPTETVYGLGADAGNGEAVARLYDAKGRPTFNPLIAHVADAAAAHRLARFDDAAERLARAFWPGPLTLVLPQQADCPVSELATAGIDTIGVRVPSHPVAHAILAASGIEPPDEAAALIAPGQMASHYAPRARLRLHAREVRPGEALLAFGAARAEGAETAVMTLNLSQRGDLIEAAANLFSHLRALDESGATTIAITPVPRQGLGEAINDRL